VSRAIFGEAMLAAARSERDYRQANYPRRIADGRSAAEEATADYQAWVAIAEWLETGRFTSFDGGTDFGTRIDWPFLEAAAEKALTAIDARLEQSPSAERQLRRDRLFIIHRAIARQRALIDGINQQLRAQPARKAAA